MGDEVVIDGGMASFEVIEKIGNDLRCKCTDPGLLLPRAKLSFWRDGKLVEKNYELPTISTKVVFKCCLLHFVLDLWLVLLYTSVFKIFFDGFIKCMPWIKSFELKGKILEKICMYKD